VKKWAIVIVLIVVIGGLYFIEISKIDTSDKTSEAMPTLDDLKFDEAAQNWEDFYKVRATIIDGQTATFSIPERLLKKEGKEMELTGAAVFFGPGCRTSGENVAVHSLFLYPTLGLANACEHLPEVAMRWTIRINLSEEWLISKTDMIDAMIKVKGTFRIDTKKPYESAFFLDNAHVELIQNEEVRF